MEKVNFYIQWMLEFLFDAKRTGFATNSALERNES